MASRRDDPDSVGDTNGGADALANGAMGSPGGSVLIDLDFVRALIAAVDGSGIDTLEISRGGTKVRISKSPVQVGGAAVGPVAVAPPVASAPALAIAGNPGPAALPAESAAAPAEAPSGPALVDVKSPMVGTFYRAPAPEAPPYVEVGATVGQGQTLCILEAMKLMNELECEVDGVVRQILVENADPVEYGQVLFRIEPTGSAA
jgi:acetyl-CoA carboxylase biotin carboxyl carrier protein